MRLIAIFIVAVLSVCATIYQPVETPAIAANASPATTQQEQVAPPTVPTAEPTTEPTHPQESNMAPTTDTESASAGTAAAIAEAVPTEEDEPPMEMAPAIVETPSTVGELTIVESAETDIPTVVEHAKTGTPDDTPVIVEHAKTGYEGEDITPAEPPVVEPEQPAEPTNINEAIAAAEAFAIETYNVTIDPSLAFNNSAYRFPAAAPLDASQEFLNNKAIGIAEYTFQQQIRQFDVTTEKMRETGIRCKVHIEQSGNDLLVYCFYA